MVQELAIGSNKVVDRSGRCANIVLTITKQSMEGQTIWQQKTHSIVFMQI